MHYKVVLKVISFQLYKGNVCVVVIDDASSAYFHRVVGVGASANQLEQTAVTLSAFSTDTAGELDVLRHDRHTLGVDRTQVGVFKQPDQVRLGRLLQRQHRRRLKAQIRLEILRDFTHETLERELANQKLGRLLVFPTHTHEHTHTTSSVIDIANHRAILGFQNIV